MICFNSILAGIAISIGAIVYLKVGGVAGALLFSVGLLAVVGHDFSLFTGKAGKFATKEISIRQLLAIWCGNFIGAVLMGLLFPMPEAAAIIASRCSSPIYMNFIQSIFCGFLMFVAVNGYQRHGNYLYVVLPVAAFILCGFQHCVADMFYFASGRGDILSGCLHLLVITVGNFIGCNIIPIRVRLI